MHRRRTQTSSAASLQTLACRTAGPMTPSCRLSASRPLADWSSPLGLRSSMSPGRQTLIPSTLRRSSSTSLFKLRTFRAFAKVRRSLPVQARKCQCRLVPIHLDGGAVRASGTGAKAHNVITHAEPGAPCRVGPRRTSLVAAGQQTVEPPSQYLEVDRGKSDKQGGHQRVDPALAHESR